MSRTQPKITQHMKNFGNLNLKEKRQSIDAKPWVTQVSHLLDNVKATVITMLHEVRANTLQTNGKVVNLSIEIENI